jgi:IgGFc binding protein
VFAGDPKTCNEAAQTKSYVGCDFWPTVTANAVWPIFDFAVVVANTQNAPADVTIERDGSVVMQGTVSANGLEKFYLPWVDALKGPTMNACGYLGDNLATVVDPATEYSEQKGDPAESQMTAVEQYRKKYVFLAPDDYMVSYVDVVLPDGATVSLDGQPLDAPAAPIANGYSVTRQKLGAGNQGAHVLESDQPVGIQVMGYGWQTSYQYPGGSNLLLIAPPPDPIK